MSVHLPPFRIGTEPGEPSGVPASITVTRLHEALAGRDPRVNALAALRLVAASDLPDKGALLAGALRNRELMPGARRKAAILLAYAGTPESERILLDALADSEPRVQAAAAKGLGWIGGSAAFEPLVTLMRRAPGAVAVQAEWAARLIAHRHGLDAPELPPLRLGQIVEFTSDRRPIDILRARPERLRLCLDSISRRDFRLRFDSSLAHELHCGRSEWMLLLTQEAASSPVSLLGRRSIAAVPALFIAEEQSFSIALVALVEPGGQLVVCRSTGEPIFAGRMNTSGDRADFSLRALSRPGAFPLIFDGSMSPAELSIREAESGPVLIPKRRPVPIDFTAR